MAVALYGISALLIALLAFSAVMKLSGKPAVIESYAKVGVERKWLPLLAFILFVGAGGLLAGLWWTPIGVAAAAALVMYFSLALVAHAHHGDMAHAATPAVLLLLAALDVALLLSV